METPEHSRILLVDDDTAVLGMLRTLFEDDYKILFATSGFEAIEVVKQTTDIAAVVMDIKMAGMDGITAARQVRHLRPDMPIIFHTGYPGEYDEREIDASDQPFDYIQKGKSIPKLLRSVRNAVESYWLKQDNHALCRLAESNFGILGNSPGMREVFRLIRRVAPTDNKVVILGETGTGKELVARAIHTQSKRKDKRLGVLNCNHKAPDLIESELFGHTKGAFTGAVADRVGLFEFANGGTVFLDEIGDLDITTQAKILRALETGEYHKIGSPDAKKTDVRVLCATHRNLEEMVRQGTFREDLYYRLKGITITLPPLRDRREDIPLLVEKFAARFTAEQGLHPRIFDQSAIDTLVAYDWPGNVRQLLDTVESVITLTDSEIIFGVDVSTFFGRPATLRIDEHGNLPMRLRDLERAFIIEALKETGYNISAAAKLLGVDRSNLQKKIKAHSITFPDLPD